MRLEHGDEELSLGERLVRVALGLVEQQLVNLGHIVGAADVLAHADARELGHRVGEGGDRERQVNDAHPLDPIFADEGHVTEPNRRHRYGGEVCSNVVRTCEYQIWRIC